MATSSSARASSDKDESAAIASEIQAEITKVRKDVADLAQSLSAYGKARVGDLHDRASDLPGDIQEASRQALKELRREINLLETKIGSQVKEHPMQSLLLAAGLGALLTTLLRR